MDRRNRIPYLHKFKEKTLAAQHLKHTRLRNLSPSRITIYFRTKTTLTPPPEPIWAKYYENLIHPWFPLLPFLKGNCVQPVDLMDGLQSNCKSTLHCYCYRKFLVGDKVFKLVTGVTAEKDARRKSEAKATCRIEYKKEVEWEDSDICHQLVQIVPSIALFVVDNFGCIYRFMKKINPQYHSMYTSVNDALRYFALV